MAIAPEEAAPDLQVERAAHGLRLRGTQLYLDPIGRPQLGFLAHARGARATLPERTVATAATVALLEAAQPRALRRAAPLPAAWRKAFSLGALSLTLYPAGHVLGSAQLLCELDGRTILYTGDLGGTGDRAPSTAERQEQVTCDTLLLRATYGHPRYSFPPRAEVLEDLSRFVAGALAERRTPVVLAASLGGAQEAMRHLAAHELRVHSLPLRFAEVYRAQGVELPKAQPLGVMQPGQIMLLAAHPRSRRHVQEIGAHRVCILSGRAVEPGYAARIGVDLALPISDHAGFADLVEYASRSGASRVLTVHGYAEDLARALRDRGLRAQHAGEHNRQLDLL